MDQITINRGSDLTLTGTWRDASGAAMNLTGWDIAVFDAHHSLATMAVEWVNAAAGTYTARIDWSDSIPTGRIAHFRLRISKDGDDRSSPRIWVIVQ